MFSGGSDPAFSTEGWDGVGFILRAAPNEALQPIGEKTALASG
jgi:hypothetical protein